MNNSSNNAPTKSIAFIVAAPVTAEAFLAPHIRKLADQYQITVIGKKITQSKSLDPRANLIDVNIERQINLKSDLKACIDLFKILRRENFDVVQSMTPKAGLITSLAAFMVRVPTRIHWFTGQVWVTRSGFSRRLLKILDRVTARLSTHILVDSKSQMAFLEINHVAKSEKMTVLANGSTRGVGCNTYRIASSVRSSIRHSLGIGGDEKIILFVGRMNRDKGIGELLEAFALLPSDHNAHLILVGHDEDGFKERLANGSDKYRDKVHFVGYKENVIDYMVESDIFALPSYREGLPISMLEAGAVGLPLIGTKIDGITDIVENNVNGILVRAGDAKELFQALDTLLRNNSLRRRLGDEAAKSIRLRFNEELLLNAYEKFLTERISGVKI